MASLTVRQLDDQLKQHLRLRAARNGRSVENEVRTILRAAAEGEPSALAAPPAATEQPAVTRSRHVLVIIGGGIAAYKSLDLIRRLRERGLGLRVILTKAAQEFTTPLAAGAIAGGRVFTDLFDPAHEFD
ncbi:MAG: flavoprotein, partial [Pseudolabrys sp.]